MKIDFRYVAKHYASRDQAKMKEVLMDPSADGPAVYYYLIRGGINQKNITVLEPGTVGGEYIKTYGHYHVGDLDETYWFLYGEGVALLQKMIDDRVVEFKAVKVKAGDTIYMPAGYGHLVVNTGTTYMVTADDSPVDFEEKDPVSLPGHADYELVKKFKGFAYYVVEGKDGPVLKPNPNYQGNIQKQDLGCLQVEE